MRTGSDYLRSLDDGRQVFVDGERVKDVTTHLAFREAARSIARLYDIAAAPEMRERMTFVSPKTGRAVSRTAAEPYRDRLIALPAFLSTGGLPADEAELRLGLDLTGYFLEHHVFWPHNKPLPAARARFMETLNRQ